MKRLTFLCMLILLVWGFSQTSAINAQNQPAQLLQEKQNNPLSQPNSPANHNKPQQEQRGTKHAPLFVEIAPGDRADKEAAEAKRISDEKTAERRHQEIITSTYHGIYASGAQALGLLATIAVMIFTAIRQLRAYLSISASNWLITDSKDGIEIALCLKNVGKTPAFKLTHWIRVTDDTKKDRTAFPSEPFHRVPIYLPPDAGMDLARHWDTAWKVSELFPGDAENPVYVYIWGEVQYRDAFHFKRFVKFRFIINRHGDGVEYTYDGNDAN